MCRLIESIKVINRQLCNLKYHQERMDRTRKEFLGLDESLELLKEIYIPNSLTNELYKCRVVYSSIIHKIEFVLYEKRKVNTLQVVRDDEIDYTFKFENRERLTQLKNSVKEDDIVIVKKGMVTDAFSSNIVFSDGVKYFTPSTPLLAGTKRAKLLEEKIIFEEEIREADIQKFKSAYLINAMLDPEPESSITTNNIII